MLPIFYGSSGKKANTTVFSLRCQIKGMAACRRPAPAGSARLLLRPGDNEILAFGDPDASQRKQS